MPAFPELTRAREVDIECEETTLRDDEAVDDVAVEAAARRSAAASASTAAICAFCSAASVGYNSE